MFNRIIFLVLEIYISQRDHNQRDIRTSNSIFQVNIFSLKQSLTNPWHIIFKDSHLLLKLWDSKKLYAPHLNGISRKINLGCFPLTICYHALFCFTVHTTCLSELDLKALITTLSPSSSPFPKFSGS